ncbi:hypothetical protein UFOVP1444_54 [uncultured Caudovirales phage]|uniref:Uncharacterized protein n=1 Tax=uncultured Caudovirales phage TaxID=2100421 RepID=A0A6J5SGW1_9CAUD|nr:hypothetical protein UFOVP1444_54 [uncultured Caudovirales phage]CAB5228042.1 hypothetical protein UFOVP1536_42 [uncultured Caudovirales phage]
MRDLRQASYARIRAARHRLRQARIYQIPFQVSISWYDFSLVERNCSLLATGLANGQTGGIGLESFSAFRERVFVGDNAFVNGFIGQQIFVFLLKNDSVVLKE